MPMPSCVNSLGRIADTWLRRDDPIRLKAVEALQVSTGYRREVIAQALDNAFIELTQDKLEDYLEKVKLGSAAFSDSVVIHIGAGNVFTSWLPGAVISLMMGFRCWIKPSTQEPVFAHLWKESVQEIDPTLSERISIVSYSDDLLKQAQAVVAYGADATLQTIRQKLPQGTLFIGYGHKISVAVVFKEALAGPERSLWLERAVSDCVLFDLGGCLSPRIIFLESKDTAAWDFLSKRVSQTPILRPFSRLEEVLEGLEPFRASVSCVGVGGGLEQIEPIRHYLEGLGTTRICPLGEMQRPPLSWRNGGISLAERLGPFLPRPTGKAYNSAQPTQSPGLRSQKDVSLLSEL